MASYKKSPMLDYFLKEPAKDGHFTGLGKDNGTQGKAAAKSNL
jgi:hypothetical protein